MRVLCILAAATAIAGCDRKRTVGPKPAGEPSADAGVEGAGQAGPPEVTVVGWQFVPVGRADAEPPRHRVLLTKTIETGAREPVEVGEFEGACRSWTPDGEPDVPRAFTGFECVHAGAGIRVRVVRRGGELILLEAELDEMLDELSYEQKREPVPVRPGATVRAAE